MEDPGCYVRINWGRGQKEQRKRIRKERSIEGYFVQ